MSLTRATPSAAGAGRLFRLGSSDEYGPHQALAALVVVLAPIAFLGCASLAGGRITLWLLVAAPLLVLLVPHPDSVLPFGFWALLGVVWVVEVPGPFTWWSVPAAVSALLAHVAFSRLAGSPTTVRWPRATRVRQSRRVGVVAAATVLVAALAQLVLRLEPGGQVVVVVAAMLAVAGWLWIGRWRDESRAGSAADS